MYKVSFWGQTSIYIYKYIYKNQRFEPKTWTKHTKTHTCLSKHKLYSYPPSMALEVQHPRKINMGSIIPWRIWFRWFSFLFMDDLYRFQSFNLPGWSMAFASEVRATPDPERSPHLVVPCIAFQHVPNHLPWRSSRGFFFRRETTKVVGFFRVKWFNKRQSSKMDVFFFSWWFI